MYPFERFDQGAKKVLTLAQDEATRAGHDYIGTEHLLLALLRSETSAAGILRELGAEEAAVRQTIEGMLGQNQGVVVERIVPTARVRKVIELAFFMARREASSSVSAEHLLLGLLAEGEGVAAHVMRDLGITIDRVQGQRGAGGGGRQAWPAPGERVLVHDPDPPYRLWEGAVNGHRGELVEVTIAQHPTRREVALPPTDLHPVPPSGTSSCRRCLYRAEQARPPRN